MTSNELPSALASLVSSRGDMDLASARVAGGDKEELARQLLAAGLPEMQEAAKIIILAHLLQVIEAYSFHSINAIDGLDPVQIPRHLGYFLDRAFLYTTVSDDAAISQAESQLDSITRAIERGRGAARSGSSLN